MLNYLEKQINKFKSPILYDNLDILIVFFICAGGVSSILYSIQILTSVRIKQRIHFYHAGIFFIFGFNILCDPFYRIGTEWVVPHVLYLNYPLMYLLSPLMLFYFKSLFSEKFRYRKKDLLFLVPFVLVTCAFIPYYILPAKEKLELFPIDLNGTEYLKFICRITESLMFIWHSLCVIVTFINTRYIWNKKLTSLRFLSTYLALWIPLSLSIAISDFFSMTDLYRANLFITTIMVITLALYMSRYPVFFKLIREQTKLLKYTQSRIKMLNTKVILERIDYLMNEKYLYLDEDLNLKSLALMLKISPEQLSEVINSHLTKNYNTFINHYKIKASKKILSEDSQCNILEIAIASGFNSKSTFYTVFKHDTGMTPTEYRKNAYKMLK